MIANSKILVKNSNLEVMEMTIEELASHKQRDKFFVFGMLYISNGVAYDFIPFREINVCKNNGSGLFKVTYETPKGTTDSIICDKNTQIMAGGTNYWKSENPFTWSSFTNIFNVNELVYVYDITGCKCKVIDVAKLKPSEEPQDLYFINTKTKNIFANGVLIKCR